MTTSNKEKLLEKALQIAVNAHFGQTDKAGKPYIFHPLRVMNNCSTVDEKIVAILHDVIEDTEVTADQLIAEKFPRYIVDAIVALTKQQDESYEKFVRRIAWDKLAVAVKIQDIKDNMDVSRLSELNEIDTDRLNKYINALRILKGSMN